MPVVFDLNNPNGPDGKGTSATSPAKSGGGKRSNGKGGAVADSPSGIRQALLGALLAIITVAALIAVGMQVFRHPRETGSNGPARSQSAASSGSQPVPERATLGPLPMTRRAAPAGSSSRMGSPAPVIPGTASGIRTRPSTGQQGESDGETQEPGIH